MDLFRLPSSSSAIIALSTLTPPSPILSPSQLQFPTTLTSGDIPLLLPDLSDHELGGFNQQSYDCTTEHLSALPYILTSGINSFGTVGTFGLGRRGVTWEYDDPSASSPASSRRSSIISPACPEYLPPTIDQLRRDNTTIPDQSTSGVHTCPVSILSLTQLGESCPATPPGGDQLKLGESVGKDTVLDAYTRSVAVATTLATLEAVKPELLLPFPQSLHSSKARRLQETSRSPSRPWIARKPALPKHLEWLEETTVEVSIDQEGFRAVQARFKFASYSSQAHRVLGSYGDSIAVAQFRPVTRQAFYFHYAPFDGLPVLRRITVNNDESRDHISRQASLSLKSNGVYTVRGHESSSLSETHKEQVSKGHSKGDPTKLSWSFEYLVDNRKSELFGKRAVDGEKVLTPLAFACSPLLLHPDQGKKIRLMHIVKKSVAIKLVAEKMEPPIISPGSHASRMSESTRPPIPPKATPLSNKTNVWNHRRTNSCVPPHTEIPQDFQRNPDGKSGSGGYHIRHRRASSAGELDGPGNALSSPPRAPSVQLTKHIISHSSLVKLLNIDQNAVPSVVIHSKRSIPDFQPLSPSPRHRRGRLPS